MAIKKMSKGLSAALVLSIIIAFMISLIPNLQVFKLNQDFPVFKTQKQANITENNIVEFVASLPVEMQIKKVVRKQETLSIDFILSETKQVDTNIIYKDIYHVIRAGLVQSNNLKTIFVRVFLEDMNTIFVAVTANKSDIEKNPMMVKDTNLSYKMYLEDNFGLNYGNFLKQD